MRISKYPLISTPLDGTEELLVNKNGITKKTTVSNVMGITPNSGGIITPSVDTNFANADLTATGNRVHDFSGNDLTIKSLNNLSFLGKTEALSITGTVVIGEFNLNILIRLNRAQYPDIFTNFTAAFTGGSYTGYLDHQVITCNFDNRFTSIDYYYYYPAFLPPGNFEVSDMIAIIEYPIQCSMRLPIIGSANGLQVLAFENGIAKKANLDVIFLTGTEIDKPLTGTLVTLIDGYTLGAKNSLQIGVNNDEVYTENGTDAFFSLTSIINGGQKRNNAVLSCGSVNNLSSSITIDTKNDFFTSIKLLVFTPLNEKEFSIFSDTTNSNKNTALISDSDPLAKGLVGNIDFSPNIGDLNYVQKVYVDQKIAANTLQKVLDNGSTLDKNTIITSPLHSIKIISADSFGMNSELFIAGENNTLCAQNADFSLQSCLQITPRNSNVFVSSGANTKLLEITSTNVKIYTNGVAKEIVTQNENYLGIRTDNPTSALTIASAFDENTDITFQDGYADSTIISYYGQLIMGCNVKRRNIGGDGSINIIGGKSSSLLLGRDYLSLQMGQNAVAGQGANLVNYLVINNSQPSVAVTLGDNAATLDLKGTFLKYNNKNVATINYKVYTALLYQTGTNVPLAIVLENTLGFLPIYRRSSMGTYYINNPELVLLNPSKIAVIISGHTQEFTSNAGETSNFYAGVNSEEMIIIITTRLDSIKKDSILSDANDFKNTFFEIRVYD